MRPGFSATEWLNRARTAADNSGHAKDLVRARGARTSFGLRSQFPRDQGIAMPVIPSSVRRELTPEAQAAAAWLRALARTIKLSRLYQNDNPLVQKSRETVVESLKKLVAQRDLELRFTATEILRGDEVLVIGGYSESLGGDGGEDPIPSALDQLPFIFYRDGVRRIVIRAAIPQEQSEALVEALSAAGGASAAGEDLVTMLWQANLTHVMVESVPLEQTIYLSSHEGSGGGGGGGGDGSGDGSGGAEKKSGYNYAGGEIHADLGLGAGPQGLHKDSFDDWEVKEAEIHVPAAFEAMQAKIDIARVSLFRQWEEERTMEWTLTAPELLRRILRLQPDDDTRGAVAHAAASWVASALERFAWLEARAAIELLNELDPEMRLSGEELASSLAGIDGKELSERLDEGDADEHGRFAGCMVALGAYAVPTVCSALGHSQRGKTRAALCTALTYLCTDRPDLLAPYLKDSRWYMVRNIVFVLGQLGGPEIVELLRIASRHSEVRVRRQVVHSLGNVPLGERVPLLIAQLETRDPQLLSAALNLLAREKDPRIAKAILERIMSPDFESRSENNRRALFNALAEVAGDDAVPALELLLHKGGWFTRRTLERTAAARTLARIGTDKAHAVLDAGLRSRSDAVRAACLEAMGSGPKGAM